MNKLYKLTSNNLIQTWEIEVEGAKFRTHEGILDGTITTSKWTICEGKNEGRANATSPEEQASREALAKWTKKRETYYEDLKDINKKQFFEPMLAFPLDKYPDLEFPVYTQAKLDGIRCIATRHGLFSRNGKPIVSAPHVHKALERLFNETDIKVLDGELYNHRFRDDFNKIISMAKRTKPSHADLEESAQHLQYWVYDFCDEGFTPFHKRIARLEGALLDFTDQSIIKQVVTYHVKDSTDLDEYFSDFLGEGFEGQMIRRPEGIYENKRSKNLLKRKTFQDAEFQILDILPGQGNLADIAAIACFKTKEGRPFSAGIIGNQDYARSLLDNKQKVIGRQATVVFQNYTPDFIPRFPKMKQVRDYE